MHKPIPEPSCATSFSIKLPTLMILLSHLLLSTAGQSVFISEAKAAEIDVAGTYVIDDISYTSTMPLSDKRFFFGADPDIEFTLIQKGDKISGEFSGDRDGKIFKGTIDDDELNIEFYLESLGGEIKDGTATWKVGDDGTLKGDFKIRDPQKGVVRGFWTLEKEVVVAAAPASEAKATELDVAGTYEIDDISYTSTMPLSDKRFFFGADPDIEFTLIQKGDKISGEFSGDRDGKIFKGTIDDDELNIEFYLESLGGEIKDGTATWKVGDDGALKGDFKIRDPQKGVVRGFWRLEKID